MSLDGVQHLAFMPLNRNWVPSLWPLLENDTESIPKSWPKTYDELANWALGTRKQQTIADRSVILVESDNSQHYLPVGLITADLVRGKNAETFPGAKYGDVNIAYLIFSEFRCKGFAAKALNQVRDAWIQDNKHPVLRIASENTASQQVAKKAGFIFVDTHENDGRELQLYRAHN